MTVYGNMAAALRFYPLNEYEHIVMPDSDWPVDWKLPWSRSCNDANLYISLPV